MSRVHSPKQTAGYRAHVTIGDGGHRMRAPYAPGAPEPKCAVCGFIPANFWVPGPGDPQLLDYSRARRVCGFCAYDQRRRRP